MLPLALLLASLPLAAAPVLARGAPGADYAKDVGFLLDELEKQAGDLLKQKDIDWKAVRAEFGPAAAKVKDDAAHVDLCARLLARLQDGHAAITELEAKLPERPPRYGVGLSLCEVGNKVYVKQALGAAQASGVKPGFEVLEIEGQKPREWLDAATRKLVDVHGFSTAHAARNAACHWGFEGEDGTSFRLSFGKVGGKKNVTLACAKGAGEARIVGPVFPPKELQPLGKRDAWGKLESGLGYILLGECNGELASELDQALAGLAEAPGIVIDMRANRGGGTDHEQVFGRFLAPDTKWRQYESCGPNPYAGALVVIVDAGTASTGETISGQFKEDGRAFLIGPSPTHGMSSQKQELTVPSGLFKLRFSVSSNKQRFNGGKGIEGIGVAPHEVVAWDPKLLLEGVDPMIRRAEVLLTKGFPKGAVPYEPPKKKK